MLTRILTAWHRIWMSLWALPLLMVLVAAATALLAVHLPLSQDDSSVWFLYSGNAEEAPPFLTSLVTAMITMATLVVSITMVVLTLAAQQLGPRLIRSFMADRRTQATLGLFIATVVYLLLVLRAAYGNVEEVPNLAVSIGTLLVLLCLMALLVFVHHLARSIIADNTIERVGETLDEDIKRLLPEREADRASEPETRPSQTGAPLSLTANGYVQALNYDGLVDCAKDADAVIEISFKPGRHVVAGSTYAWISPADAANDGIQDQIENCVIVGGERASVQDLEASVRQLVEVALRALSPSINDPFTAMAVIDRLTTSLAKMMRRGPAQCVWTDSDGAVRLLAPHSTFADIVQEAFRQIRQHGSEQPAILIRLVESLGQLLALADKDQCATLKEQVEIVLETGRRDIPQKQDLESLERRAKEALDRAKEIVPKD
ncbi:DUF2254 domain-containing protein [Methyloceanibacter caenitepidi]|uniref:DUF2254 domain-containing protein n=1 Tax=Methyloceanibacter caenitepidi TaxID=1384459 RepID=A0A0A8K779_9HYPH|nr:DUF2254 domain-containing protein [Methyloceanibacter caenitepidi]BAQ17839.1 hypothetical protein GL4_2403 [Methyloceanibacter caenitepidi]